MNAAPIKLRALTEADLPLTLTWHNLADIVDMYAGHPFPVNKEMEQLWYQKILTSNYPVTVLGIELVSDDTLIGISCLKAINMIDRSSEAAIYIGATQHRGKGYAAKALQLTLDFAFNKLGLHRVWLKLRTDNQAALKLYQKAGLKQEGLMRESVFKNGKFYDMYVMSILDREYNELYST